MGEGIDINIQELYSFLSLNYNEGDEIYMFGFSRGSYTVRSLAGMINESGLVRRSHIQFIKEAYELYRDNMDIESERARTFRAEHGDRVPIKLLACFDTVGSLGIQFGGPIGTINRRYEFHDISLSAIIENAIHLMAIDEDREVFAPTRMEAHSDVPNQLTQLYFPGTHGGVGGGCKELEPLANCCLEFLIEEMKRRGLGLEFEEELIPTGDPTVELPPNEPSRLFKMIAKVTGRFIREIPDVEQLHLPTVRARYQARSEWRPPTLDSFRDILLRDDDESPRSNRKSGFHRPFFACFCVCFFGSMLVPYNPLYQDDFLVSHTLLDLGNPPSHLTSPIFSNSENATTPIHKPQSKQPHSTPPSPNFAGRAKFRSAKYRSPSSQGFSPSIYPYPGQTSFPIYPLLFEV
uniref:T6SS Phospholipase effector Tle1-like catalytic domain-containing protein n=1 Tax=Compsopogon caeruleus TaxID=31354 RepID=A0A7S1TE90_9RHOD|mmetsp:Transcript_2141/g.3719  ORF Transcript_2141/g.3719 Transcript_2141/m.3719 type:complete len:406 (+) Transcript_2141:652-1869(+)